MTAFEEARHDVRRILYGLGPRRPVGFSPTCWCGTRNWPDAKTCSECGSRLYPSKNELRSANRG